MVPLCCPGESRGNKTTKLFSKHRHYLNRSRSLFVLPPKADIGTQSRDVRFVPKADIAVHAKCDRVSPRPRLRTEIANEVPNRADAKKLRL